MRKTTAQCAFCPFYRQRKAALHQCACECCISSLQHQKEPTYWYSWKRVKWRNCASRLRLKRGENVATLCLPVNCRCIFFSYDQWLIIIKKITKNRKQWRHCAVTGLLSSLLFIWKNGDCCWKPYTKQKAANSQLHNRRSLSEKV